MTSMGNIMGMIAVDKMGAEVLFLNPLTYEVETAIKGFPRTVHELLVVRETGTAYVPIFGDGIHGRNPIQAICFASLISKTASVRRISICGPTLRLTR